MKAFVMKQIGQVGFMEKPIPRPGPGDAIVHFTREDVVTRIGELTQGEGVDAAIEALGADVTFQTAVKITKPGGTVSNTGYFGEGAVGLDGSGLASPPRWL